MRIGGARLLGVAVGVVFFLTAARAGEEKAAPAGAVILTEGSVWRTHVTWGKALMQGASGVKDANIWNNMTAQSALPAENWMQPEFDDSAWGLWRETHVPNTLKTKDGKDTGVRVYDWWQYGTQLSAFTALRCLRSKFAVEDPAQVKGLDLALAYRGGAVVYVNGREVGRGHVPKGAPTDRTGPADPYPDEVYYDPAGKLWWLVNSFQAEPTDPATLGKFNGRIRSLTLTIPPGALRKGVNVLALELHRAPYSEKAMSERESTAWGWSTCGLVSAELRAEGAVTPATARPKGIQVWNASVLAKIRPFGSVISGRWGQGAMVAIYNFPVTWAPPCDQPAPVRIVGTRNGVFSGQVVVSSDAPIRNAKAVMSDLLQAQGGGRIPAAAGQVCYTTFTEDPPTVLTDPAISLLDVLYEQPPAEVPVLRGKPQEPAPVGACMHEFRSQSWCDSGAVMPVWLKVRVPADAPVGDYGGTLTVSADGLKPVAVPVRLSVHGFVLPAPRDFVTHVGLVHSPDTLALKYKAPLWSDQHFKLMEKSCAYMGELGGKVVWLPLITDTWLGNREGFVYWVKQGDGSYKHDLKVFDRYLDLVQKHLKPEAVNLYVYHPPYGRGEFKRKVSLLGASGKVEPMETPVYAAGPEAEKFWKPAIAEARERLKKRGLPEPSLGLVIENGEGMQPAVECFKAAWPEGKWAHLAHYGGSQGHIFGTPYGYVMSVWGLAHAPWKSKKWGAPELPCVFIEHFRADPMIDLRPTASRGSQYWAVECAMGGTRGIGPLGMDFWNLTPEEGGWKGGARCLEGGVTNLSMCMFTTAAYLAPGPDGPLSTARFEVFREGLQAAEAHAVIEKALGAPATRQRLGDALVKRCEELSKERGQMLGFVAAGERFAQGEGWKWFETSGWEELAGKLFDCAAEVSKAVGGK